MNRIKFIGDLTNWMDFRDELIKYLNACDTELKLNNLLTAILASFSPSVEDTNEKRKQLGLPPLSEEDKNKMDKFLEDEE